MGRENVLLTGSSAWLEEHKLFIHRLKTINTYSALQRMFDDSVNWNFLSHNTAGDDSLFITVSKAFELAFGVDTLIKGKLAKEVEKRLRESKVPLAVATYVDEKSGKNNTSRAILRRHLPEFADAIFPIASERYLPDDGSPITVSIPEVKEVRVEGPIIVKKPMRRRFYVGAR